MTVSIRCNTLRLGCSRLHEHGRDACARSCSVPMRKSWGNAEIKMSQQLSCRAPAKAADPTSAPHQNSGRTTHAGAPFPSPAYLDSSRSARGCADKHENFFCCFFFFFSIAISDEPDKQPLAVAIVQGTVIASKLLWRPLALTRGGGSASAYSPCLHHPSFPLLSNRGDSCMHFPRTTRNH